jgi:hypothetical protein
MPLKIQSLAGLASPGRRLVKPKAAMPAENGLVYLAALAKALAQGGGKDWEYGIVASRICRGCCGRKVRFRIQRHLQSLQRARWMFGWVGPIACADRSFVCLGVVVWARIRSCMRCCGEKRFEKPTSRGGAAPQLPLSLSQLAATDFGWNQATTSSRSIISSSSAY